LVSNNTDNSSLAKAGEVITLSFSSSESIDRPSVNLGGEMKLALGSDTSWSITYEVQPGDDGVISSPLELNGLVLWLDAENVDGEQNNSLNSDSDIGKWTDLSGEGNHALATSFSNPPTLQTSGVQNLIRFESSQRQSLAMSAVEQLRFGPNQDFSYVVVLKTGSISDVHEAGILSKRNSYEGYQLYIIKSSGKAYSYLGQPESPYLKTVPSNSVHDGELQILMSTYDRDSSNFMYQNGVEIGSSNISTIINSETNYPLEIGHEFFNRHTSKY
jgi:hypothetical protein